MQEDSSLVEAFRGGDNAAFEALYSRHVRSVYDFVYVRTHHRQTAEDIVSQTFLQALEGIGSFDAEKGTFAGWLHRIARNLVVDHFRRLRPADSIEDAWDLPGDADVPVDADTALQVGKIRTLLKGMSPRQRDTVLLRLWHGRSFAEIAEILGTSEAACKMTYKRTVEKLQAALLVLLLLSILSPA